VIRFGEPTKHPEAGIWFKATKLPHFQLRRLELRETCAFGLGGGPGNRDKIVGRERLKIRPKLNKASALGRGTPRARKQSVDRWRNV